MVLPKSTAFIAPLFPFLRKIGSLTLSGLHNISKQSTSIYSECVDPVFSLFGAGMVALILRWAKTSLWQRQRDEIFMSVITFGNLVHILVSRLLCSCMSRYPILAKFIQHSTSAATPSVCIMPQISYNLEDSFILPICRIFLLYFIWDYNHVVHVNSRLLMYIRCLSNYNTCRVFKSS